MAGLVRRGPDAEDVGPENVESGLPKCPFEDAARTASRR
jgi:hypothetical protein